MKEGRTRRTGGRKRRGRKLREGNIGSKEGKINGRKMKEGCKGRNETTEGS